jgi:lipoate---protein ligase
MRYLSRVFATPEEELACDEVLLDICEEEPDGEVLRVWQPRSRYVVLGYANAAAREVNLAACAAEGVPVYRRTTGGGTIVQMPGCLNYAVILRQERDAALAGIPGTNAFILQRVAGALSTLTGEPVEPAGQTDLCMRDRKVAGNAQRRRTRALLFHGTLLLHADLPGIEKLLPYPSAQPDYRQDRSHRDFLANLNINASSAVAALRTTWHADDPYTYSIDDRIAALIQTTYGNRDWIMRR